MRNPFRSSATLVIISVLLFGGSPAQASDDPSEKLLVDVLRTSPDALPITVTAEDGSPLGAIDMDARRSGAGFTYTPVGGERAVFWQRDKTPDKEVRFLSLTPDGRLLRVYSAVRGLLGVRCQVDEIDTGSGAMSTGDMSNEACNERMLALAKSAE